MACKATLAEGYSRWAAAYDAFAGPYYVQGLESLLPLVSLPRRPAILEVGCGTGNNLLAAARRFGPCRLLCGLDLSPGMVERARAKAAWLGVPANFAVGDAESLPYPDGIFDLVIANGVLHWLQRRDRALSEARRVLVPGGWLVAISATHPCFPEWYEALGAVLRLLAGPRTPCPHPPALHPGELTALLAQAGFQVVHHHLGLQRMAVADAEVFSHLMAAAAPHWAAGLTPSQQAAVPVLLGRALKALSPGGFAVTWAVAAAVARRPGMGHGFPDHPTAIPSLQK